MISLVGILAVFASAAGSTSAHIGTFRAADPRMAANAQLRTFEFAGTLAEEPRAGIFV
jgi:hypothetical protein